MKMSKMMVAVFDNEKNAYAGSRALADLHRDGSITVYASAVVARDASGKVDVKDGTDEGPVATALGMVTGALVGLLGGPPGAVVGAAVGGVLGSVGDLVNVGVGATFVDDVAAQLEPGKVAIVAEIAEGWTTPLDTRIEELGGTLIRRYRLDVEDEQITREIEAIRTDLHALEDELQKAGVEQKAKLEARIQETREKLSAARARAEAKLEAIQQEADAKIRAVKQQIAKADADRKEKLQKRVDEIQREHAVRSAKLKEAWKLTQEALAV
jgi:uncharacterized membrane protein